MRLYGICTVRFIVESEEIIKETAKYYYVKLGSMSAYNHKRQILKDDRMLAFAPEDAYAKFQANQMDKIRRLKENIAYTEEGIVKASNALH